MPVDVLEATGIHEGKILFRVDVGFAAVGCLLVRHPQEDYSCRGRVPGTGLTQLGTNLAHWRIPIAAEYAQRRRRRHSKALIPRCYGVARRAAL